MKKNFITTLFMSAASMVMAFTLTNCGSEVEIDDNNNGGITVKSGQTVFSTGGTTRTSMDADRYFYWEPGDKIWVNTTGTTYQPSISSTISSQTKVASCDFVLDENLQDDTSLVTYTGTYATSGNSVTIANNQTQKAWNDGSHLGTSGDCGTATAKRRGGGSYGFQLLHRASYLVIYPYIPEATGCTLTEIEITSDNTIAGTYPFGADGLNTSTVTSPSNTIKLTPASGSTLTIDNTSGKHVFVVIQPGTHSLSVNCTFKDASNQPFTKTKRLETNRTFNENGVTVINFPLSVINIDPNFEFTSETFYMWDAKTWMFEGMTGLPTENNVQSTYIGTYAATSWNNLIDGGSADRGSNRFASYSAKGMPCVNALSWYFSDSVYYDTTTEWMFSGRVRTGGWWIRKWNNIPGKPAGSTIGNCPPASASFSNKSTTNGKPGPGYIDTFFFVPNLGYYDETGTYSGLSKYTYKTNVTYFWLSSLEGDRERAPYGILNLSYAYWGQGTMRYGSGYVAGTRPDGSPWFQ